MDKIYIICSEEYEPERKENMETQLENGNFNKNKIEYFCKNWKTDLNLEIKYDDCIFENLNLGEISVFINHMEILKNIKNNFTEGNFLILESDAYAYPGLEFTQNKIDKILEFNNNWDIINIGGSCQQLFQEHGYPKTEPILFDNTKFYNENRLICIESLLWNYNSICKFLNLFDNFKKKYNYKIHLQIDVLLDFFVENNQLNLYWIHPYLVKQGSGSVWKSNIR